VLSNTPFKPYTLPGRVRWRRRTVVVRKHFGRACCDAACPPPPFTRHPICTPRLLPHILRTPSYCCRAFLPQLTWACGPIVFLFPMQTIAYRCAAYCHTPPTPPTRSYLYLRHGLPTFPRALDTTPFCICTHCLPHARTYACRAHAAHSTALPALLDEHSRVAGGYVDGSIRYCGRRCGDTPVVPHLLPSLGWFATARLLRRTFTLGGALCAHSPVPIPRYVHARAPLYRYPTTAGQRLRASTLLCGGATAGVLLWAPCPLAGRTPLPRCRTRLLPSCRQRCGLGARWTWPAFACHRLPNVGWRQCPHSPHMPRPSPAYRRL